MDFSKPKLFSKHRGKIKRTHRAFYTFVDLWRDWLRWSLGFFSVIVLQLLFLWLVFYWRLQEICLQQWYQFDKLCIAVRLRLSRSLRIHVHAFTCAKRKDIHLNIVYTKSWTLWQLPSFLCSEKGVEGGANEKEAAMPLLHKTVKSIKYHI